MTETADSTPIPVNDLHFDRDNPRLAEYGVLPSSTDEDILKILWDAMDIRELVQSITSGLPGILRSLPRGFRGFA